ncbi:MAG: ATP synthase epsilon chain [uncultured Rubrobacteraceae bacterium]|uniref:ATP synthase epsilon chain n=1 Tax=uncultured Rubrobacteraceae bacterium TaxID=349277 RepID=A0A6J4PUA8_9ACTN|nr:MAG: ATP synthase epsilon chain [uncultured Rubrobacteraceae bacterium]
MSEEGNQQQEGRQLFCRVITPQEVVYDGEADLVVLRIADGDIGVMRDHAPVVSTVEPREVRITQDDERYVYATSDGFFKVSENLVQILVEEAVAPDDIDVNEAESRVEDAENELSELSEDEENERQRADVERRRQVAENLARVAREYGEG